MTKVEFCRDCRLSTAGNCGNHGSPSPIIGEPRLIEPCYGQCGLTLLRTQLEALEQEMRKRAEGITPVHDNDLIEWADTLRSLRGQ